MGSHRVGHDWSDLAASEINNGLIHMSLKPTDNKNVYIKNEKKYGSKSVNWI